MEKDVEFLDFVVKALVDNKDAVKIDRKIDEMGVLLTLSVDPSDLGKVIGRNGSTARAIRTLLRIIGYKNGARVNLRILDPNNPGGQAKEQTSNEAPQTSMDDVENVIDDLKKEEN